MHARVISLSAVLMTMAGACASSGTEGTTTGGSTSSGGTTASATTGGTGGTTGSGFAIVAAMGNPIQAVAGDAIALSVLQVQPDGGMVALPGTATVAWSGLPTVTALPAESTAASPMPAFGATPTAVFFDNPGRPDRNAGLAGVVFVLDPGTTSNPSVSVTATITGITPGGVATASIGISPTPTGDATRGATIFGASGANCADCHGATGHGSPQNSSGTYTLGGNDYTFPAPGLNAEPGNVASDPDWNAALLAMAARSDVDNGGVTLRLPMVNYLAKTSPGTGMLLTTQDLADVFAFLQTQTQ